MYKSPVEYATAAMGPLQCPVCGIGLEVRLARGRRSGKAFLMAVCPKDGRHIRAFINDQEYVRKDLDRAEGQS